jgi:phage terminase small subunit
MGHEQRFREEVGVPHTHENAVPKALEMLDTLRKNIEAAGSNAKSMKKSPHMQNYSALIEAISGLGREIKLTPADRAKLQAHAAFVNSLTVP